MHKHILGFLTFFILLSTFSIAQVTVGDDQATLDYNNPKEYEIAAITVSGIKYLDQNALKILSGLSVGEKVKVPGEKFTKAIENLWKQGLLTDVKIVATRIEGKKIFIDLQLQEKPRLSKFSFTGVRKGHADKIREKIQISKGRVHFYKEKGFLNAKVNLTTIKDTTETNSEILVINVDKGKRVKIHRVNIIGNEEVSSVKLKRAMKGTREQRWRYFFNSKKFDEDKYTDDKSNLISKYNEKGYRDAQIISDSIRYLW